MRGIRLGRRFFALPLTSELDALCGSNANPATSSPGENALPVENKKRYSRGAPIWEGYSPWAKIFRLAASERARRALRLKCEPSAHKCAVFEKRPLWQKDKDSAMESLSFCVITHSLIQRTTEGSNCAFVLYIL